MRKEHGRSVLSLYDGTDGPGTTIETSMSPKVSKGWRHRYYTCSTAVFLTKYIANNTDTFSSASRAHTMGEC